MNDTPEDERLPSWWAGNSLAKRVLSGADVDGRRLSLRDAGSLSQSLEIETVLLTAMNAGTFADSDSRMTKRRAGNLVGETRRSVGWTTAGGLCCARTDPKRCGVKCVLAAKKSSSLRPPI
jgi:hypothetical protein